MTAPVSQRNGRHRDVPARAGGADDARRRRGPAERERGGGGEAGTASNGVPPRPVTSSTAVVAVGPRAKPMLPPRANQLIPVAVPPARSRAARDASGW